MPEAFTILTTEPEPDVPPIHNRQVVVLDRSDWTAWLGLTRTKVELLKALPAGSLQVEQVQCDGGKRREGGASPVGPRSSALLGPGAPFRPFGLDR